MHLGHRLGEQRRGLEEADGLRAGDGQGNACADPGNHRGRASGSARRGDRREIAALQNTDELIRCRIRMTQADATQVRNDGRSLHAQSHVDGTDQGGHLGFRAGLASRGLSALPGGVRRKRVDGVDLPRHCQTKRFARSRSSAKSISTA